jgi:hypothetical protein
VESIRARERPKEVSVNQALINIIPKSTFVSYILQLRELAKEKDKLEKETIIRMTQSKILLGSRRTKRGGGNASIGDKDDWCLEDELLQPGDVVVVDDNNAYQLFGDRIFCAPQEDIIESTQSNVSGFPCITYCS